MSSPNQLHAYIDEAGHRSASERSSAHFVMSAVIVPAAREADAADTLAALRLELARPPGATLHWHNLRSHSERLHAASRVGSARWATVASVVVRKRHLITTSRWSDDDVYLYALGCLLGRLSRYARAEHKRLGYTLSHVVRFKTATLRTYEEAMRSSAADIVWQSLDPRGGHIDQPSRVELLQASDIAASATFAAFEPDRFGHTEQRYLTLLGPAVYRCRRLPVTSCGLAIVPWSHNTRAAYPWVAAL